uniref:Immunoglobulin domain-containing protein n=1 Tax=Chrysemys picta bellii TaxID=8478 RepID=A0A8C3HNL0_CHRPI
PGDCAGVCLMACLLLTAELRYPKPSISLRPSGGVALGGAVTVRCRGLYQNVRFLLYKDGKWTMLQDMDAAVDLVEFPIRNVSWRDAGSYSCYYCSKWYPFTWSHPSDPVELVVAGEGPGSVSPLPAPHPAGPSGAGASVTVRCECRCRGARFLLSKAGDLDARRATDSAGDVVEFPIRSVSQGDAGNYSCQYSTKWDPPIWSEPSDPVELVVAGEGPGSASPLPAAHPAGPSGGLGPFGILRARLSLRWEVGGWAQGPDQDPAAHCGGVSIPQMPSWAKGSSWMYW